MALIETLVKDCGGKAKGSILFPGIRPPITYRSSSGRTPVELPPPSSTPAGEDQGAR